jgi:hypothetical protein
MSIYLSPGIPVLVLLGLINLAVYMELIGLWFSRILEELMVWGYYSMNYLIICCLFCCLSRAWMDAGCWLQMQRFIWIFCRSNWSYGRSIVVSAILLLYGSICLVLVLTSTNNRATLHIHQFQLFRQKTNSSPLLNKNLHRTSKINEHPNILNILTFYNIKNND